MNRTLLRRARTLLRAENLSAEGERAFLTRAFALAWAQKNICKTPDETLRALEPFLPPDERSVSAGTRRNVNALLEKVKTGPEGALNAFTPAILSLICEQTNENRRSRGVFYTPEHTACLLARKTLDTWLNGQNTTSAPASFTACDPAAGAGGLLIALWLELEKYTPAPPHAAPGELLTEISQRMYAADLDAFALKTLRLRGALTVFARGAAPGADLFPNLLAADALAGEKTSVWREKFPRVFEQGGFDAVISNPPYVGQKNHKSVFESLRASPRWQPYLAPKGDLLYLFFHLALEILKPGGTGGFLTTAYFTQSASAAGLRKRLEQEAVFLHLAEFPGQKVFTDAQGQHNLISVFQKTQDKTARCTRRFGEEQDSVPQQKLYAGPERFLITRPEDALLASLLKKMADAPLRLKDMAHISNGLMTGCDKISAAHLRRHQLPGVKKGEGVFVLSRAQKDALGLSAGEQEKLKPFFKNSDIFPYAARTAPKYWLIDFFYPNDRDLNVAHYPRFMKHLARFKSVLLARKQNNNGIDKQLQKGVYWFGSVRRRFNFDAEKLAAPQRSRRNTFAYVPGPWYASSDVYFVSSPRHGLSLWYLLALLNSAPYYAWLFQHGKRKGNLLELYAQPLGNIPVPRADKKSQTALETLAKEIYRQKTANPAANTRREEKEINRRVGDLFGLTPAELEKTEELQAKNS